MRDFYDDYGNPEAKQAIVDRHMARLRLDSPSQHPDIAARKAREAADRLLVHDKRFDLNRSDEAVARRLGYSAGDDGANE